MKKVKQTNQNSGTPMLSTPSPALQMATHLQTQSSMQQLYNSTKRTTHNKSVNNNPQLERPTPSAMLQMPEAKERFSTGVLESGSLSLKPSSNQRDSKGPEGQGDSRAQVHRHHKKSGSTEGTPGSTIPSKINPTLKNKQGFEKYHPGSRDDNVQPSSKPSSGGNQSKLGQYKQSAANHKRLQGSGNKR